MSQNTWMQGFVLDRKEPAADQKNGCEHAMYDQVLNQKRLFRFILQFDFPPMATVASLASLKWTQHSDAIFTPITPATFIHKIALKPSLGWRFRQFFTWTAGGHGPEKVFLNKRIKPASVCAPVFRVCVVKWFWPRE